VLTTSLSLSLSLSLCAQVETVFQSLSDDFVYVLDAGSRIFQWNGMATKYYVRRNTCVFYARSLSLSLSLSV